MQGIVIKSTGSSYKILASDNNTYDCGIKGKFRIQGIKSTNPVAVGDNVIIERDNDAGIYLITKIEDRKNYIIRKSVNLSKQTQIIAANIDQALLIVTLASPKTQTGFIDRFLLSAEAFHITPIILFNKSDLYQGQEWIEYEFLKNVYSNMGYRVEATSCNNPEDIKLVKEILTDKISVLSGNSGVGKSSILNGVKPGLEAKVGIVSESSQKGKHTTTFAEMFFIDENIKIIDTPGIKSFGVVELEKEELAGYFADMRMIAKNCKFNNCTHINEPKCAVKEAVEKGEIAEFRYHNYLNIYNSEELEDEY